MVSSPTPQSAGLKLAFLFVRPEFLENGNTNGDEALKLFPTFPFQLALPRSASCAISAVKRTERS